MSEREQIIDWIKKAFLENSEVLKHSVNVCGIIFCGSTNNFGKDSSQSCMAKAINNIDFHSDDVNPFATQNRSICCICRVTNDFYSILFPQIICLGFYFLFFIKG